MALLHTRRLPFLTFIAVTVVVLGLGGWFLIQHDWHRRTVLVNGTQRTYLWYEPIAASEELRPLVLAYHGFNGPAERMRRGSKLHEMVDSQDFYLAYIQGDPSWYFFERAELGGNPDILMFDALRRNLLQRYAIDPQRIYVVGMSRGGNFVIHLGLRRSESIAALVAQGACEFDEYQADRPLPMMFIVGTKDGEVSTETIETVPDLYRERGHAIEVLRPQDVPHRWEVPLNDEVWRFLSQYALPPGDR